MANPLQQAQAALEDAGFHPPLAAVLVAAGGMLLLLLLAVIVERLTRALGRAISTATTKRLAESANVTLWRDALKRHLVINRSSHIVGTLLVYVLTPWVLHAYPHVMAVVRITIEVYLVLVFVIAINATARVIGDVLALKNPAQTVPLRIAVQTVQIIVSVVGIVVAISLVTHLSVAALLSSVAGATAVFMLLFKDSILGFAAGIQIASNEMLSIGDWIEMPQYGANGTVLDVGLTTVKVQNFDKTITTIPTYSLVSQSFKNWRGMEQSGVRRIKRSLLIDMQSVRYLSSDEITDLRDIRYLQSYFTSQLKEIEQYNDQFAGEERRPPNARGLTNLGLFRVYIEHYLQGHPLIDGNLLVLIRHLEPTAYGIPIEVYAFSKEQDWKAYEQIQADIFDHLLAIVPRFGLRIMQLSNATAPPALAGQS
ncbi:MAG: mechanosensitive ion channel domain-containing protein [Planctomycetota bacterium]